MQISLDKTIFQTAYNFTFDPFPTNLWNFKISMFSHEIIQIFYTCIVISYFIIEVSRMMCPWENLVCQNPNFKASQNKKYTFLF